MPITNKYSGYKLRQTRSSRRQISEAECETDSKDGINSSSDSESDKCVKIKSIDKSKNPFQNEEEQDNGNKLVTPRKKKSINENDLNSVTPPKQRKKTLLVSTPSTLLRNLSITSPKSNSQDEVKLGPKKLFEETNTYQSARKALRSTLPTSLPGRENELLELNNFIKELLIEKKSGTLYVSGPPGTGKTASLSIILNDKKIASKLQRVYINCTSIKSSKSIFSHIVKELDIEHAGKGEKDCISAIRRYLSKSHKMLLLVLDEIDQLESKNQSVLYTIFEWPSLQNSKVILIGIANSLDLTDRILPRLQARCELKPKLMHFAPYNKQQIIMIFMERLKEANVLDIFTPVALQMLAGKVAAISGDVRRALDIGRRVIEMVEQNQRHDVLKSLENITVENDIKAPENKAVELGQVLNVLNNIYCTTKNLDDEDDSMPLQQKLILCTILLILKYSKNKDITVGKLHDVYKKVCSKRNILAVDQGEFVGLCSLIETRGIIRISGKKEPRLQKVNLEWDQEEVTGILKDKKLLSVILDDDFFLGKI